VPAPRVVERVVERIVVASPPPTPEEARLRCPRCATGMPERRIGPGVAAGCRSCGGLWLDTAIVDRLRAARDEELESALRKPFGVVLVMGPTPNRTARISCPECAGPMRWVEIPDSPHGVDVCDAHGTWFDARELAAFLESEAAARAGEVTTDDLQSAGVGGFFARLFRTPPRR
jgi:Zn-finger nucleic acid-binding protein